MKNLVGLTLVLLGLFLTPAFAWAQQVTPQELSAATEMKIDRVPEFALIRQLALQYGVNAYLFGGTASSFAHYVRLDMACKTFDSRYVQRDFDYSLESIYRRNQDFDIVLDANPIIAQLIMAAIMKQFPYVDGDKSRWEIRLLRYPFGKTPALVGDYDFLNQHSDSNSTGLITLTQSDPQKQIYFDLRDPENPNSIFLKDLAAGRITFHFSQTHETTSWAKKGTNPAILAAVRYLSKLTQHELIGTDQDLAKVMAIIAQTDLNTLAPYAQKRLKIFALKALLNSPDVEYAWNLLDDVGLRQKLIEWDKHEINVPESLAWWMSKEPLRSFEVGAGSGKTAEELGIEFVAHDTKSIEAYERLTSSQTGHVNAFISRRRTSAENALSADGGEGFYTANGTNGAFANGMTIRLRVDPKARETRDFTFHNTGNVVFHNKNALKIAGDNSGFSLKDFISSLGSRGLTPSEVGMITIEAPKLLGKRAKPIQIEETERVLNELPVDLNSLQIFEALLKSVDSLTWPPLYSAFQTFLSRATGNWKTAIAKFLVENILTRNTAPNFPQWLGLLIQHRLAQDEILTLLSTSEWSKHPEAMSELVDKWPDLKIERYLFSNPSFQNNPEIFDRFIEAMIANSNVDHYITLYPLYATTPESVVDIEVDPRLPASSQRLVLLYILSKPQWAKNPNALEWLQKLFKMDQPDAENRTSEEQNFVRRVNELLAQPDWANNERLRAICNGSSPSFECLKRTVQSAVSFNRNQDSCANLLEGAR